jgi:Tfp pilus assembly protein FimV
LEKDEQEGGTDQKLLSYSQSDNPPTSPSTHTFSAATTHVSPSNTPAMTTLTSPMSKVPTSPSSTSDGVGPLPGAKLNSSGSEARIRTFSQGSNSGAHLLVETPAVSASSSPRLGTKDAGGKAADDLEKNKLESKVKALEATIRKLESDLGTKAKQMESLLGQNTDLRRRSLNVPNSPSSPQVITKTIVNPSFYSPQFVMVIAIISFLTGAIVF